MNPLLQIGPALEAVGVLPGRLELALSCTGLGVLELEPLELEPGQRVDLGEIRLPPLGRLRLERAAGADESLRIVQHLDAPDSKPVVLQRELDPSAQEAVSLVPGRYTLRVFSNQTLKHTERFTIEPGFETLLVLDARD